MGRRVPGLRREELALIAGVSVDYIVRLEQGRARNPLPAVTGLVGPGAASGSGGLMWARVGRPVLAPLIGLGARSRGALK
jgi:hypothetical protein